MLFFSKQTCVVLLFHRVSPIRDKMWDPIDPELFEQTLKYVSRKFHVISLSELLFERPSRSGKPLASITFDDGYHDFIDYSVPLLNKFGLPSSLFVVTDCIDKDFPTWTYFMDYLFENTKKLDLKDFYFPGLPKEFQKGEWRTREERIKFGKRIKQFIKGVPSNIRDQIIGNIGSNFSDVALPKNLMLSWEELKELQASGIEIGSHTVSHPTLATIKEESELKFELESSARILKERLGSVSPVLSYPCGSYNENVKKITRDAGYRAGLAVNGRLYNYVKDDIFEVPRIELYNQSWTKTRLRINGTISFIEKFLRK